MEDITYSLRKGEKTSDCYYSVIREFADEVSSYIHYEMCDLLESFCSFVSERGYETVRTKEEYGIELLMTGVYLAAYSNQAICLGSVQQRLITAVAAQREKGKLQKHVCDFIKGKFAVPVLMRTRSAGIVSSAAAEHVYHFEQFIKLVKWLEAAGDYKQEVRRLRHWSDFYAILPKEKRNDWLERIAVLTQWFEKASAEAIGSYTKGVGNYVKAGLTAHRGKEDLLLCSRPTLEYHLNMVGAEIMNKALREAFLKTTEKIIFLPRCMCKRGEEKCCAVKSNKGYICQHCEKTCSVYVLTKQGIEKNFSVYIIPHESDFYYGKTDENEKAGIIGIACVLNLLSGGFKAIDMGFVPQCVVLDGCGCKNHWHKTGIVTEINHLQLSKIIKRNG